MRRSHSLSRYAVPVGRPAGRPLAGQLRVGFTLVELLVVIAIIGTLVALLLPAVQAAREAGRNNTCKNNVKQLITAMTNYDSSQSKLPSYVNEIASRASAKVNDTFAVGRRASWIVMIFPYIEQQALWDRWNQDFSGVPPALVTSLLTPKLESMVCPSDPDVLPDNPSNSYVANAGQAYGCGVRGESAFQGVFSDLNTEYAANGVFFDGNRRWTGNPPGGGWLNQQDVLDGPPAAAAVPVFQMSINYVSSNDGTSNTMMISENLNALEYTYPQGVNIPDAKHHFGFVWHGLPNASDPTNYPVTQQRLNGGREIGVITPDNFGNFPEQLGYPSSSHPGGVNVAFCDGRVVFVNESIDEGVYAQLMTSNQRRSKYVLYEGAGPVGTDRTLPQPSSSDF